jgi:hypothetical protein
MTAKKKYESKRTPEQRKTLKKNYRDMDEKKRICMELYLSGNQRKVAANNNMNESVLRAWKQTEWFADLWQDITDECEDKIRAQWDDIIDKATDETRDRLANGDTHINTRTGEVHRAPVKARDAATIAAIAYDKRRISLNMPVSITASAGSTKALERLADTFRKLADDNALKTTIPATEYKDVTPSSDADD